MVSGWCKEFDKGGLTRELFDVSSSFGKGVVNFKELWEFLFGGRKIVRSRYFGCSEQGVWQKDSRMVVLRLVFHGF